MSEIGGKGSRPDPLGFDGLQGSLWGSAPATVRAQRVEVHVPRRVPPGARLYPALALFVGEESEAVAAVAPLRALFALLDREGATEVHRRTRARTSWHLVEQERPDVVLRLEISEPADARGVVDVVMDSAEYQRAWQLIREGEWVGITSGRRLRPSEDGSRPALEDVFAACIPLDADLPPTLAAMAHHAA